MSRSNILIISLLAVALTIYFGNAAVIGLDFGSEFLKLSSISPGKTFVIVENTSTKRKTENALAFFNNERLYESASILKRPRAYNNTFIFINKFLGVKFDDERIRQLSKDLLEDYTFLPTERGTIGFGLANFKLGKEAEDQSIELSTEEIIAMILKHTRNLAEKQAGLSIKDLAITVPPYWAFQERYALQGAAILAGYNPLAFIQENTAAALYHGIERFDENQTYTAIFYNLGSSELKVTLIEFSAENSTEKIDKGKKFESVTILADTWDTEVSSYLMDLNLAKYLWTEFDNQASRKGKTSITTSQAAIAKLIREANRVKESLSANKQTQLYIESLFEGEDFKLTVDRATFEKINEKIFERLTNPIDELLAKANKNIDDVDAFEIIGAGVRVPKVQQVLSTYLKGKEVAAHINGDEAFALGAGFHAANLSSAFKTKTVYLNDGYNFDIHLHIENLHEESEDSSEEVFQKNAVIFPTKTRFGTKRVISFTHGEDIKIVLTFINNKGENETIAVFNVTGITGYPDFERFIDKNITEPKISLHLRLSNLGFIELLKAEAAFEETKLIEEVESKPKAPKQKPKAKVTSTEESTDESEKEKESSDDSTDSSNSEKETKTDSDSSQSDETSSEEATDSTTPSEEQTPEKKFKKRIVNHNLELDVHEFIPGPGRLTDSQIKESLRKLKKFDDYEQQLKKRAEAKNNLESLVYRIRDHLDESEFNEYAKQQEVDDLTNYASEFSEFLYSDEADDATSDEFSSKFYKVNGILKPILFRIEQSQALEQAIEDAREKLYDYPKKIEDLTKTKTWIKAEEKKQLSDSVETTKEWLELMVEKQSKLDKNEDPVLTTAQISNKIQSLTETFTRLKNSQKPKAPRNNFINFGGGEGENSYYENLRKQYGMSPDATYDEIFQEFMVRSGNKFSNGPDDAAPPKREQAPPENKEENTKKEDKKPEETTESHDSKPNEQADEHHEDHKPAESGDESQESQQDSQDNTDPDEQKRHGSSGDL